MRTPLQILLDLFNLRSGEPLPQLQSILTQDPRVGHQNVEISTGEGYFSSALGGIERHSRYIDYEAMDRSGGGVGRYLNLIADECLPGSGSDKDVLWVESKSSKVKSEIEKLFNILEFPDSLFSLIRTLARSGDLFAYPIVDGKNGVQNLVFLPPMSVQAYTHPNNGKVIGYSTDAMEVPALDLSTSGGIPGLPDSKQATAMAPWELVHWKIRGKDPTSVYGTSMIEEARMPWRDLLQMESSVLIYRIHSTGTKVIYYIDVGQSPPDQARKLVERWRRALDQNVVLRKSGSVADGLGEKDTLLQRYRPHSMHDKIFWPRPKDSTSEIDIQNVSGSIVAVEDLQYFVDKVRMSLGVPKAYYDGDISGWSANKALAQQDVQFARQVIKLGRSFLAGLSRLCNVHLVARGVPDDEIMKGFKLRLLPPSSLFEIQDLEAETRRLALAVDMMGVAQSFGLDERKWAGMILKSHLHMSPSDIKGLMVDDPDPVQTEPSSGSTKKSDDEEAIGGNVMSPKTDSLHHPGRVNDAIVAGVQRLKDRSGSGIKIIEEMVSEGYLGNDVILEKYIATFLD